MRTVRVAVGSVALLLAAPLLAAPLLACAPLVRPPTFAGAQSQVTDATLAGPFDGQVLDAATGDPVVDATVVGVWTYARGDGFIGPYGSETFETATDRAGRYRIPPSPLAIRGSTVRLVDFHLVIYKRGFVGYRSDTTFEGSPRADFTVRHNRALLRKWRESDSHAAHLAFLAPPRTIARQAAWEYELANLDLYRELGGLGAGEPASAAGEAGPAKRRESEWLDASALLTPDGIRQRTRTRDRFTVGELTDLERTFFYHGVHFQAQGRSEPYDVGLRVWQAPPGGLDPVIETIETSMPGAAKTKDVTDETWVLEVEGVIAVGFIDRADKIGVLLTCGDMQCHDLATALILAKHIHRSLDKLRAVPAGTRVEIRDEEPRAPAAPKPEAGDDEDEGDEPPAQPGKPAEAKPAEAKPAESKPAAKPAGGPR